MTLKVAIVGVGNIGNTHAPVYMENTDTKIVAVCDIVKEKADKAAQQYGAKAFYSVKEMLASEIQLDLVSVCTKGEENGGEHYAPTMELLEAGIPVLGEKPISNKLEEAQEMVDYAQEKQIPYAVNLIPYAVNLNHRFTPAAERAKSWIEAGRLGKIHMINMRMWINNPILLKPLHGSIFVLCIPIPLM